MCKTHRTWNCSVLHSDMYIGFIFGLTQRITELMPREIELTLLFVRLMDNSAFAGY